MVQEYEDSIVKWYLDTCGNKQICEAMLFDLALWGVVLMLCVVFGALWAWAMERDIEED